jgi:hypothetical protein
VGVQRYSGHAEGTRPHERVGLTGTAKAAIDGWIDRLPRQVIEQLLLLHPAGIPYQALLNHNIPCPDRLRENRRLREARRHPS